MKIREAKISDSKNIWLWRIDKETVMFSQSKRIIKWEEHQKWFKNNFKSKKRIIYIADKNIKNKSLGCVSFELKNNKKAEVSIFLNPKYKGKNLSFKILSSAIKEFQKNFKVYLTARILSDNTKSIKIFERCNFGLLKKTKKILFYVNKQVFIDEIEKVRSRNNINWMNLLRLSYKLNPNEADKIVKNIDNDDRTISKLLKKLISD